MHPSSDLNSLHRADQDQLTSPVAQTMERLVTGQYANDTEIMSRVYSDIHAGNPAKIYTLVDNDCVVRDCFMKFFDDGAIGSICFVMYQDGVESTMRIPLNLISDIWLGKQTSALLDPSIPDDITDLACTILCFIDNSSTEVNFSTETAEALNTWIIAINHIMRRSGRQLCRSDVDATGAPAPPSSSSSPVSNHRKSNSKSGNQQGNNSSNSAQKRRFSIVAEPPTKALRESNTEERTRYLALRLHIRANVNPALKSLVESKNRTRPAIASLLQNFSSYLASSKREIVNTVRGFTDISETLTIALQRERNKSKVLLNKLIEEQGNIRVFARVRPLLGFEEQSTCITIENAVQEPNKPSQYNNNNNNNNIHTTSSTNDTSEFQDLASVIAGEEGSVSVITAERNVGPFKFDKVFGPEASQNTVAREIVPFVHSCIDGYNVCILAYGQTGSGKTFTMEGTRESPGVNYRALDELFRRTNELQRLASTSNVDLEYSVTLSAIEIYNETPRDLLFTGTDPSLNKLEIRGNEKSVIIPGLTTVTVKSVEEVRHWLVTKAYKNRAVGCTNMNATSSRSHCAIFIKTQCENKSNGQITSGKLVMVDLAGSERIDKSGATGVAKDEATNINQSLSALGNVISSLLSKQKDKNRHISYRDSKLTLLLQDCIGGNSKCLMFCNLSPASSNHSESVCTLRFASRAKEVQLGKAKKNTSGVAGNAASSSTTGVSSTGIPNGISNGSTSNLSSTVQNVALQANNSQLTTELRQKDKEINSLKQYLKRAEEEESKAKQRIFELESMLANGNTGNNSVMLNNSNIQNSRHSIYGTPSRRNLHSRQMMTDHSSQNNNNNNNNNSNNNHHNNAPGYGSGDFDDEEFGTEHTMRMFENLTPGGISQLTADLSCTDSDIKDAARQLALKRKIENDYSGRASKMQNRSSTPGKSRPSNYSLPYSGQPSMGGNMRRSQQVQQPQQQPFNSRMSSIGTRNMMNSMSGIGERKSAAQPMSSMNRRPPSSSNVGTTSFSGIPITGRQSNARSALAKR